MIRISHLSKSFGEVRVLRDVNVEVGRGEVVSVIGPSGSGKSTLLRCLNLLERPNCGTIEIGGVEITAPGADIASVRHKMGMVFQNFNLFGNLNAIDNITAAPCDLLHVPVAEARAKAMRLLRRVGLADRAAAMPDELSGGQKQRVAIARALATDPEILLFDEPTSALDPTMVGEVLGVVRELANSGMTMVIVTHEMGFARDISTRILYLDEGVVYEQGTPVEIFGSPKRAKTVQFISGVCIKQVNDMVRILREGILEDGRVSVAEAEMLRHIIKPAVRLGDGNAAHLSSALAEMLADGMITSAESQVIAKMIKGI